MSLAIQEPDCGARQKRNETQKGEENVSKTVQRKKEKKEGYDSS